MFWLHETEHPRGERRKRNQGARGGKAPVGILGGTEPSEGSSPVAQTGLPSRIALQPGPKSAALAPPALPVEGGSGRGGRKRNILPNGIRQRLSPRLSPRAPETSLADGHKAPLSLRSLSTHCLWRGYNRPEPQFLTVVQPPCGFRAWQAGKLPQGSRHKFLVNQRLVAAEVACQPAWFKSGLFWVTVRTLSVSALVGQLAAGCCGLLLRHA